MDQHNKVHGWIQIAKRRILDCTAQLRIGSDMAWFAKLAHPGLARLAGARSLASSTTTTAAQAKVIRTERERVAAQDRELNNDGPYSAPQMKTTMPGPKSRVRISLQCSCMNKVGYLWPVV